MKELNRFRQFLAEELEQPKPIVFTRKGPNWAPPGSLLRKKNWAHKFEFDETPGQLTIEGIQIPEVFNGVWYIQGEMDKKFRFRGMPVEEVTPEEWKSACIELKNQILKLYGRDPKYTSDRIDIDYWANKDWTENPDSEHPHFFQVRIPRNLGIVQIV